ncbi:SpoIIE family protein phosphatase, partial [bacterium]|nr:SpoIIE family protein phosphatase [bacterium]
RTIRLFDEPYLAAASPLPLAQKGQGFYVIMTSLENTYTFLSTFKQSVFWTSLLILCGVLLLAYILSRGITAPVRRLSDAVSLISEGRYDVEIPIKTGDEIEQLAQRVSNLAHKLRKRNDEVKRYVTRIENWNKELEKSVQERTTDLKEKNLRLQVISKELGRAYEKIDEELKTVGDMQKNLLPPDTVNIKGVKIHTFYYPNGRAGGDYYDIIKTGKNQVFILMADVSGHGIPAAFIMGMTRAMAHTLIEKGSSPSEVLLSLSNILLKTIRRGEFVTMFLARLDLRKQELVFSSAGHPPPLFFHPQVPQFSELSVKQGVPLGIMENPVYEEIPIPFHAEDRLFLYTDGLVEAFDEQKNTYSLERIKEIMKNNIQMNPEGVIELAIRDLESHIGKPLDLEGLEDDVTIMIVQFPYVESLAG